MAVEVVQPIRATCCGMAGDRGMLHPELTASATAEEAAELAGTRHDAYLCSNRTCEIGLQEGTGAAYESFVIPLERISRLRGRAALTRAPRPGNGSAPRRPSPARGEGRSGGGRGAAAFAVPPRYARGTESRTAVPLPRSPQGRRRWRCPPPYPPPDAGMYALQMWMFAFGHELP